MLALQQAWILGRGSKPVGAEGLEPTTSSASGKRSPTELRACFQRHYPCSPMITLDHGVFKTRFLYNVRRGRVK